MKLRKTIKKIVALGMGASMVGATMLGAAAYDLNDFPRPFVMGSQFNGYLVVGDNAAAQDVIGVSDVAMALQYATVPKTTTGSGVTVEGDAFHYEKGSDKLNMYQELSTIRSTLTNEDLKALADGSFRGKNTQTYTQRIKAPVSGQVGHHVYDDYDDDPQLYLKFNRNTEILNYRLNFGTAPASKVDSGGKLTDFEDNKISILGKEFTMTKALNQSGGVELTLMSGAIQATLEVGQTRTFNINGKDYEVTVMIVSGDSSSNAVVKFVINDEVTPSLSNDQTYTLNDGTDIGIKEILPTKSGDIVQNLVEFYLGAEKIVLDGVNSELDIGDDTSVDDLNVTVSTTVSGGDVKLNSIEIIMAANTDYYVPVGGTLSDAAKLENDDGVVSFLEKFGLDFHFAGAQKVNKEVVKIGRHDDDALRLTFTNKNSVEYKFPFLTVFSNNTVELGDSTAGEPMFNVEGNVVCRKGYFIIESDKTSRVLQLNDVKNSTDNKYVRLKDLGTGQTSQYDFNAATGSTTDMVIDGYTYRVTVVGGSDPTCITLNEITDSSDGKAHLWTKYGSKMNLTGQNATTSPVLYPLIFTEDDDRQEDDNSIDSFGFKFAWDSGDSVADFSGSVFTSGLASPAAELSMIGLDSDSDKSEGYTKWGTFLQRDTNGDQDEWTITIPENDLAFDVLFTAGVTTVQGSMDDDDSDGSSGSGRIDVGATKLASEVRGMETSNNLLLVGGPCANAAVQAASSQFPTCSGWSLQAGEGLIQMVEHSNGKVALLVAGTNAEDTRTATAVVAGMTKLKALPEGVMKQLVTVVSGQQVLTDVPAVVVDDAMMDEE